MATPTPIETVLPYEEEGLFARDIDGQLVRMDKLTAADFDKDVTITVDGQKVTVKKAVPATDSQGDIRRDAEGRPIPRATTIYDAAQKLFVKRPDDHNPIPILCHQEHLDPVGVCRVCVVEISKLKRGQVQRERKLLPACQHRVEETMEVHTIESPQAEPRGRVHAAVKMLAELLLADSLRGQVPDKPAPYDELAALCERLGVKKSRLGRSNRQGGRDDSSAVIAVDHQACILCDRCVRACDEVKKNYVIGRTGKGFETRIGFDLDDPMGASSCVSCGECMLSCPTSALTFRRPVEREQPASLSETPSPEALKRLPIFSGVPYKVLQWLTESIRRRTFKPGEVLCREGEPGSTAFLLISGQFQISLRSSLKTLHNERARGWRGLFGFARTTLQANQASGRVVNTGDGALSLEHPVAVRTAEDLILGDMTCMSGYPRSATVTALENAEVLEIGRNVLHYLRRNRAARDVFDRVYRARALGDCLQNSSLLSNIDDEQRRSCAEFLRDRARLVRLDGGQVILRQGDVADHFYLVRLGFVRVAQTHAGQEVVRDYLGPGSSFGEIGLLASLLELDEGSSSAKPQRGLRTATCSALGDVELVQIQLEDFQAMIARFDDVRQRLLEHARARLLQDEMTRRSLSQPLAEFLDQGLFEAQKLLVLDLESCTRCDECTKACADTHDGVTRLIREGLRFGNFLVASSCRSCLDPVCMVGCPVDAIHRRQRGRGQQSIEIVIEDWCIGCGLCARNCPYGNINMHGVSEMREDPTADPNARGVRPLMPIIQQKATTCDLCRDVVDDRHDPSCVYACPHTAAFRMSGAELLKRVNKTSD